MRIELILERATNKTKGQKEGKRGESAMVSQQHSSGKGILKLGNGNGT